MFHELDRYQIKKQLCCLGSKLQNQDIIQGCIALCLLNSVGSICPLAELTFLHKNPAVQPTGVYITIITWSEAALKHATIL